MDYLIYYWHWALANEDAIYSFGFNVFAVVVLLKFYDFFSVEDKVIALYRKFKS